MRYLVTFLGVCAGIVAPPAISAQAPATNLPPARSVPSAGTDPSIKPTLDVLHRRDLSAGLRQLMKWWPGQYDNHEQVVRQSGGGISVPSESPFRHLHTQVRVVAAPDLGENVLALEQFAGNNSADVIRREIMVLAVDVPANAIRVRRFTLADGGSLDDVAASGRLHMADLVPLQDGCGVLLRFAGGQFQGSLAPGACKIAGGQGKYELIVGGSYMWERGQASAAKGGALTWEMGPGSEYDWYQESRARPYTCNVFDSPGGEMAKSKFLQTIHLHDQGGEAEIAWPDGRTLVFTIHSRAFTAIPEREYPLFRIHEKGNPVPIAYAYAVDRNTRFGLNLGWFYIRCYDDSDIAPADMLEAQK